LTEPSLTTEQRRALEELGVERLRMRLHHMHTGIGDNASVYGVRPEVTRLQAEQWMVAELRADKRVEDERAMEALRWSKISGKWARIAGWASLVAVVLAVLVPLLQAWVGK
jgi:hypothetical protein